MCLEEWDPSRNETIRTLCFSDVAAMVTTGRRSLEALGVRHRHRVACLAYASVEFHILCLSVMASGAALVSLIWKLPNNILQATVDNVRCEHLVASRLFEAEASHLLARCPSLQGQSAMWVDGSSFDPRFVSCNPSRGVPPPALSQASQEDW